MTANDLVVGDSANYSCWPDYTYVSGNLTRTCLPILVLSGRHPTCELTCPSEISQKCKQCRGETDSADVCTFQTSQTTDEVCLEAMANELVVSVALYQGFCYKYECQEIIDGVSSSTKDWTARPTCSRGNSILFISIIR